MTQARSKPDRYISIVGIDGDRNACELMVLLRRHIDDPCKSNRFWEQFKAN